MKLHKILITILFILIGVSAYFVLSIKIGLKQKTSLYYENQQLVFYSESKFRAVYYKLNGDFTKINNSWLSLGDNLFLIEGNIDWYLTNDFEFCYLLDEESTLIEYIFDMI